MNSKPTGVNDQIRELTKPNTKVVAFFFPDDNFLSSYGRVPQRLLEENDLSVVFLYGTKGGQAEKLERSVYVGGGRLARINTVDLFLVATIMDALPAYGKRAVLNHGSFAAFRAEAEQPAFSTISSSVDPADTLTLRELAKDYVTHFYSYFPLIDYYLMASSHFKKYAFEIAKTHGLRLADGNSPADFELYDQLQSKYPKDVIDLTVDRLRAENHIFPRKVAILPTGYPQIDKGILVGQEAATSKKDTITYAPTPIDGKDEWHKFSSLKLAGEVVVRTLLDNFPNMNVVFKPHVSETNAETRRICESFSGCERFRVDLSGSNHKDLYARTAVMVSDFSQTAFTFALSYLQPVVFYSANEHLIPPAVRAEDYCLGRSKVGITATDPDELKAAISQCLSTPNQFRSRIEIFRDEFLFNTGKSEEYICSMIPYMLRSEAHPSWSIFENIVA